MYSMNMYGKKMIYWITGRKNSGKTTLAYHLKEILESYGESVVILDGDEVRDEFPIGYNDSVRWKRTYAIGKLAVIFEKQGVIPIIALLSEKKEWRIRTRKLFKKSKLIYQPGGDSIKGTNYEVPDEEELNS